MLTPFSLRNYRFAHNLIAGPIAGVSNATYRSLITHFSHPAFCYSEMISAHALVNRPDFIQQHFLNKISSEGPVCFQLFGNDAVHLAAATSFINDLPEHDLLIDLNCGCSVPKIRNNGAGSKLLENPEKLSSIIRAMRKRTDLPLIVKIRVTKNLNRNLELTDMLNHSGADAVVVHGRTPQDSWGTPCDYTAISWFVQHLQIPVIGNGDVRDSASLKSMLATGCAAVMISRALIGKPWLIEELKMIAGGNSFIPPSFKRIGEIFISHIKTLAQHSGNERSAVLKARTLAHSYAKNCSNRKIFYDRLNQTSDLATFTELCRKFFSGES